MPFVFGRSPVAAPSFEDEAAVDVDEREEGVEPELILVAFRTLLLGFLALAPSFISVNEAFTPSSVVLLIVAGLYNVAMGVACLFPAQLGVRRPIIVAMDATLITAWLHLSGRWEIISFYFVVVVVAAIWGRVFGGVVAAAVCNFLFLFLWAKATGDPNNDNPAPFTATLAVHAVLFFVIGALAGYMAEAQERERERRLERELLIANYQREIDLSSELHRTLATPEGALLLQSPLERSALHGALEIGVAARSARRFGGGDFLDVLRLPGGATLLCVADVAGKSVRAQSRLPLLKYALRALAPLHPEPAELMERLQAALAPDLGGEIYIALCLAVVDLPNSRLSWCNAGHVPPLLVAGQAVQRLQTTTPALGLFPDIAPREEALKLPPNCDLVFYTDGLTDALAVPLEDPLEAPLEGNATDIAPDETSGESRLQSLVCELLDGGTELRRDAVARQLIGAALDEESSNERERDDIAILVARIARRA